MSLRSRLALVAFAYLVIFLVGAVAIVLSFRTWSEELDDRRDLFAAARRAAQLESAYLNQQVGQRAFAVTGDRVLLAAYEEAQADAARIAAELRDIVSDDETLIGALTAVEGAGATWLDQAGDPVVDARIDEGPDAALALLDAGPSNELFQVLADRLQILSDSVDTRAQVVSEQADDRRTAVIVVLVTKLLALLLLTGMAGWWTRRWILIPVSSIADAARRVMKGERVRIAVDGPPEVADVARAVDEMQRTIVDQRDAAVRSRESLEQNALLALQMRTELTSRTGHYPPGWTVSASLRAAEGIVAGDCYDVSLLSPTEISVIVLDIAGHDALAAISAFKCKELLKAALRSGYAPGECLMWLSEQEHGLGDSFLTAVVATLDTSTSLCRYANAGHPPAVLTDSDGTVRLLEPTGPLFGLVPPGWSTDQYTLEQGAALTIYTDGLVEARDPEGRFYGDQRLVDLLGGLRECDADHIMKHVMDDLFTFRPARPADDVTVLVVCHV